MRKIVVVAAGLALLAALSPSRAQTPEGRTYTPGPFDAIEISGTADVRFTQGTTDQVFIRGDEEMQKAVQVEVRNGKLRVDQGGAWKFWGPDKVRIEIQARDLKRISISGAGSFSAPAPVRAERLLVSISGSGSARFDRLDAQALDFRIAGSGDGQASGSAKELVVRISGNGEFRGEDFRVEQGDTQISGVGDVRIWAVDSLRISVAGAGKIDYWGSPTVKRSVSGTATITDRGAKAGTR